MKIDEIYKQLTQEIPITGTKYVDLKPQDILNLIAVARAAKSVLAHTDDCYESDEKCFCGVSGLQEALKDLEG